MPNDFGRKHKAGRTAERIAVGTAGQLFDAGGQLLCSSCRFAAHSLFNLLVLLPRALGEVLLLICAGGCALRFSSRFFYALFPKEVSEQTPIRQTPQGGLLGYLLRYLIFYFLGGSVALLSSLLEFAFSLIGQ